MTELEANGMDSNNKIAVGVFTLKIRHLGGDLYEFEKLPPFSHDRQSPIDNFGT